MKVVDTLAAVFAVILGILAYYEVHSILCNLSRVMFSEVNSIVMVKQLTRAQV